MIILASNNPGKLAELTALLHPQPCVPQAALGITDIEETGLSFVENAILKARHASKLGRAPALADDSGLVVPALQGEPGIYSARYAERAGSNARNIPYLLTRMSGLPLEQRQAYFYCVMVWMAAWDDPTPVIATGRWDGVIAEELVGEKGFGYDPVFYLPALKCTAAELDSETKNQLSHRGQALAQLRLLLAASPS